MDQSKGEPAQVDWQADPYWRNRRLSPALLQVHDIRLEGWHQWRSDIGPMLEMKEILPSTLLPDLDLRRDELQEHLPFDEVSKNRSEQNRLRALAAEYGWMNCLRSSDVQRSIDDAPETRVCRWIHVSSKFSDYLSGCLLGLSDWKDRSEEAATALQQLDHCIYQNERFSKHGRYFAPFVQDLLEGYGDEEETADRPMLISVPFLDWAVDGRQPPLRFQVDPREGYQSSKGSSHLLRSILQHFYRLEDTADRESQQVFTKHKPWLTDRNLDLKVRRWYGQYPTRLNVDELWILVVDSRHIVTFSSNQSWKSRWPPLQLSSRIMEISFRGIRNSMLNSTNEHDYTSHTHVIAALSGALGMLHRSFWTDITLCLSDRYASYLGHLQYRLHRSPSTKLVMDLLQVQEELNIIIQIMDQQMELVTAVQDILPPLNNAPQHRKPNTDPKSHRKSIRINSIPHADTATYRQLSFSHLSDPSAQLLENLRHEYADLLALRENSNSLINRTIQLVNIRLEDHGKAILVFTIVTIIFLPLSFVSSFFGMNFSDIRDMETTTRLFWMVSASLTVGTVGFAVFMAFYGGKIGEWVAEWREGWRRRGKRREDVKVRERRMEGRGMGFKNFEVFDAVRVGKREML